MSARALDEAAVRALAASLDREGLAARERGGVFDRDGWRRLSAAGLAGIGNGSGQAPDMVAAVRLLEAWGEECLDHGLSLSLNAHLWGAVQVVSRFGTAAQKADWCDRLEGGAAIGALAVTEPESGSDLSNLTATAARRMDGYVLNGRKLYVSNAMVADMVVVLARLPPARGMLSGGLFLVARGTPGLSVAPMPIMGFRTAQIGEILLDHCEVPAGALIGTEGAGLALFREAIEGERRCIMAFAVGAMKRQLDSCIRRTRERRQFGKSIGDFQQISHKLVEMQLRLEAARGFLHRAAEGSPSAPRRAMLAAMAKYQISEAWVQNCQDAIQIHGASGYAADGDLERDLRDALGSRFFSGTSELQSETIARMMTIL